MKVITSIELQKTKKRVNIFIDGKFGFGLDLENFIRMGLKVGQELGGEQINLIKDRAERAKAFSKVLNYATVRPRSEKEIKDYLKRKRVDELIHPYILNKLKKLRLLDDLEFAKWWIDQRQSFSPKSKRVLTNELRIKGIDSQAIKDLLKVFEIDELKIARNLVESKKYKWDRVGGKIRKQKIAQYLANKGFNWDIINQILSMDVDIDNE